MIYQLLLALDMGRIFLSKQTVTASGQVGALVDAPFKMRCKIACTA
jgi:hypothetical protein